MDEKKKRMNPWVPAVIMGVVAILFSFYALQLQSDLQDARVEIERLKSQVTDAVKNAEMQAAMARANAMEAQRQNQIAVDALRQAEENCKKANKGR